MIDASRTGNAAAGLEGDTRVNWVLRNWLIVAASLVVLTILGSFLEGSGLYAAASLLLVVGWGIAGAVAVLDGIRRVLGSPSLLGAERGAGRLLALAQIVLGLLLLMRLLAVAMVG